MRTALAIALLALSVGACARESAPTTPPAAQTPAAQPAAAAPATAAVPAVVQAARAQETVDSALSPADRGEAALERLAALPANAQLPAGKWRAGENYIPVVPAQATSADPGQVEVLEFFWYGCPHCYALDPFLESWRKNMPANIKFVRVPVLWKPLHVNHARLFYAVQALGKLDELHAQVFDEVHRNRNMLATNDDQQSLKMQTAFVSAHGVDASDFQKAWGKSPAMDASLKKAEDAAKHYEEYVRGVPSVFVNGKYYIDLDMVTGPAQLVQLVNDLVAAETRR